MPELIPLLAAVLLWVYSYGFVDLNLTLSSQPLVLNFVSTLQKLAYFNRDDSVVVYLVLVFIFFLLYALILKVRGNGQRFPWKIMLCITAVLAFAYPFLSHDVFKYLFSARVLVDYHANPHAVSPDFFQGDLWLRFMRWVHTPSPYGPVFTAWSVPSYILAFKKFVPALYLYKLGNLAAYLISIILVGKISRLLKAGDRQAVLNQLFFAFNPLVLIEWLVNTHNDAPMMMLFLFALWFFLRGKNASSLISLALSAGVKYVTVILLPFYLLKRWLRKEHIIHVLGALFLAVPFFYNYSTQYQPWYVTWVVVMAALSPIKGVKYFAAAYSLGALLRYIPFIQHGLWLATPVEFAMLTFMLPAFYLLPAIVAKLRQK